MNSELEAKVERLQRQITRLTQKLDETRRRIGLSPILDDQVIAIDARTGNPQGVA